MICALLLQLSTISVAYADEVAVPSYLCTFTSANQGDVGPYQISSLYSSNHESDIWNNIIKSTGDSVFKYVGVNVAGNLNDKGPQKIGKNVGDSVTFSVDSTFNLNAQPFYTYSDNGNDGIPMTLTAGVNAGNTTLDGLTGTSPDGTMSITYTKGKITITRKKAGNCDTTKPFLADAKVSINGSQFYYQGLRQNAQGIFEVKTFTYTPSKKSSSATNSLTTGFFTDKPIDYWQYLDLPKDLTSISAHDSTIYIGQEWHGQDNFDGATDEDGNKVAYSDAMVSGGPVDTTKEGSTKITYTNGSAVKTITVTVKKDQSGIKTKNTELYAGETWNKTDNFVSATDEDGKQVPWEDNRIDSNKATVDTTVPTTYHLMYTFKGKAGHKDSPFDVKVKENLSSITVKNTTIKVGQTWNKTDNFVGATDEDGKPVEWADNRIDSNKATVDSSKPNVFNLHYTFKGKGKPADGSFTVTVQDPHDIGVKVKDSTLKVGEDWFPEDNFLSATNKNGDIVGFSDVDINPKTIDTTKVGETDVTYSLKSDPSLKAVAKINVIKTKATLNVKSSTILINTPWHKKDNFISATDDDGNDMGIDNPDVIIHGTVNTSKVGVYDIIYDTNYMKKKATITVVSSFGSLDFKSAPKTMDFGDVDLKVEKLLKAGIQTKDSDLVISDTRDKKGNWSVTAELSDDLATANGETLPNALYYDKNVLSKDVATTIYTVDGTLQDEDVNLSSNWSDTQGFHLETPRKGIIATDYKCSVTWGLLDVPGGDIK